MPQTACLFLFLFLCVHIAFQQSVLSLSYSSETHGNCFGNFSQLSTRNIFLQTFQKFSKLSSQAQAGRPFGLSENKNNLARAKLSSAREFFSQRSDFFFFSIISAHTLSRGAFSRSFLPIFPPSSLGNFAPNFTSQKGAKIPHLKPAQWSPNLRISASSPNNAKDRLRCLQMCSSRRANI